MSDAVTYSRPKIWLMAARPKTLILALSPVWLGGVLAMGVAEFKPAVFVATLVCTTLIQIFTNFCNDYFDFKKGADTQDRLGPPRVMQMGLLSTVEMRKAMFWVLGLSLLLGVYLVVQGGWPIALIGATGLLFGYMYTGGPFPLAYKGVSEVFVLLYFGVLAVSGTFYLQTGFWSQESFLHGLGLGLVAVAVLTLNNLRDHKQDFLAHKNTLVVRFGENMGRRLYKLSLAFAAIIPGGAVGLVLLGCALFLSFQVNKVQEPGLNKYFGLTALFSLGYTALVSLNYAM